MKLTKPQLRFVQIDEKLNSIQSSGIVKGVLEPGRYIVSRLAPAAANVASAADRFVIRSLLRFAHLCHAPHATQMGRGRSGPGRLIFANHAPSYTNALLLYTYLLYGLLIHVPRVTEGLRPGAADANR